MEFGSEGKLLCNCQNDDERLTKVKEKNSIHDDKIPKKKRKEEKTIEWIETNGKKLQQQQQHDEHLYPTLPSRLNFSNLFVY